MIRIKITTITNMNMSEANPAKLRISAARAIATTDWLGCNIVLARRLRNMKGRTTEKTSKASTATRIATIPHTRLLVM